MAGPETIEVLSEDDTRRAGALLGGLARPNDVIGLIGGLGAGKTAFAQGMARGLGVEGHVPSPTFNLLLVHPGAHTFYHFDLYRLERPRDLEDIDFHETVEAGGVTAIEWADRFPGEMPPDRLDITFEALRETGRLLRLRAGGPRSRRLAREWTAAWAGEEEK